MSFKSLLPLLIAMISAGFSFSPSKLAAQEPTPAPKPPDILFKFADDWGWGDLGCHGHPTIQTPNLDRLAKQGTDFHQFTVASGVYSPNRAGRLSGIDLPSLLQGESGEDTCCAVDSFNAALETIVSPPISPSGPALRLFQGPYFKSKFLAVSASHPARRPLAPQACQRGPHVSPTPIW